ncbi:hypothetical protein P154DRAFT_532591 [Amniculicola lignicola CBS 123094]|uniref:Uncharacterized protein n=1 Tax=Amniculicola lignicola CBS 123094 TaxID=1392246 RepID=A0A6A5WZY8_9PLEO|nr:hypothetical protein P154DRAFT_532591 [Amniculicola lignicola CBS 123094]
MASKPTPTDYTYPLQQLFDLHKAFTPTQLPQPPPFISTTSSYQTPFNNPFLNVLSKFTKRMATNSTHTTPPQPSSDPPATRQIWPPYFAAPSCIVGTLVLLTLLLTGIFSILHRRQRGARRRALALEDDVEFGKLVIDGVIVDDIEISDFKVPEEELEEDDDTDELCLLLTAPRPVTRVGVHGGLEAQFEEVRTVGGRGV